MNNPSENQYPALKLIKIFYKIIAVFIGIVILVLTIQLDSEIWIYSNDNVRSLFVFVGIFTSILITAVTYASGGMIDVLLSIESRLYRSEQIHFQTLQAQNKLSDIEQVLRRQEQQNAKILQALNSLNELERQKIEADKDVQAQ